MNRTRVIVVDDSAIALERLVQLLGTTGDIEVVGTARDVLAASGLLERTSADVAVIDLVMPGETGLASFKRLRNRIGIVAVSGYAADSPMATEAIAQGASAYVSKLDLDRPSAAIQLASAVRAARAVRPTSTTFLAIGASTGAPATVASIVEAIRGLPVSTLVVQHLPPDRVEAFANHLASTGVPTHVARDRERIERGHVYVAPGDRHLLVSPAGRIALGDGPPIRGHRPSVTALFRSLVPFGSSVMAVVLSGMGDDGADAIAPLVEQRASCIAQRPDTCAVVGMPESALRASRSVRSLTPSEIAVAARWFAENHVAAR